MNFAPLSAIDHIYTTNAFEPTTFVFRYEGRLDAQRLGDAYRETAQSFVGMGGVLAERDGGYVYDLSQPVHDVRTETVPRDTPLASCAHLVETTLGAPLARVQITDLREGGTAVSLSLSHAVADGYGMFLFLAAWAGRVRGDAPIEPNCDRSPLMKPEARRPDHVLHGGSLEHSGFFVSDGAPTGPRLRWQEDVIPLAEVKGSTEGLSTNDLLCARLWKDAVARQQVEDATFACLVDLRRHRSTLGPLFFGNAVLVAKVTCSREELMRAPVPEAARWIREAVGVVPEKIDDAIAELEAVRATHGPKFFARVHSMHERAFAVSNLTRVPFEAVDFGNGAPVQVELGSPPPRNPGCAVMAAGDNLRVISAVP